MDKEAVSLNIVEKGERYREVGRGMRQWNRKGIGRIKRKVLNRKERSNMKRPVWMVIRCNSKIKSKGIGIDRSRTIGWRAYWEVEAVIRCRGLMTCTWVVVPWCDGQVSTDSSAEHLCWASVLMVSTTMGIKDSVSTWGLSARKKKLWKNKMFMTLWASNNKLTIHWLCPH